MHDETSCRELHFAPGPSPQEVDELRELVAALLACADVAWDEGTITDEEHADFYARAQRLKVNVSAR
jgi:hypothetical protein